ncbi:MAG TPA: hypothetical protein VL172_13905, partial [Kofleriaceae bacterium]|nr:hypothetical protein [Kofleriaceae bacterium]
MATAVVIAGDDKRRSLLRAGIGAAVDEVIEVGEPEELRGGGAASLAVIAGADPAALLRRAAGRLGEDTPIVVVVDDVQPRAAVEALELEPRLVAVLAAERATPAALAALLAHVRRAGFGLTGWVPAGTEVHAAEIATYADKVACIDRLQREAEAALVRGKYRDAIAECADELMMNA